MSADIDFRLPGMPPSVPAGAVAGGMGRRNAEGARIMTAPEVAVAVRNVSLPGHPNGGYAGWTAAEWAALDVIRERAAALVTAWGADQQAKLTDMEARKDAAYQERNLVVAALAKCFSSGVARTAIDGWSEDWHGCVYIDLPTGQASWHFHDSQAYLFVGLPPYRGTWDGHTTDEKYGRVAALARLAWPPARQPLLTDAEIEAIADRIRRTTGSDAELAHAILAAAAAKGCT